MNYQVVLKQAEAVHMAVQKGHATLVELPKKIPALLDDVYAYFRAHPELKKPGFNAVLYHCGPDADLRTNGAPIEAGVIVDSPVKGDSKIVPSSLPAGPVVTTVHFGNYNKLGEAHAAIQQWLRENGRKSTGTSWEVYGHWNDDWAKVRTDIFYLLK